MTDHPPFPSCPYLSVFLFFQLVASRWRRVEAHTVARQPEQVSPPHRSRPLAARTHCSRISDSERLRHDDDDDSDHRF